MVEIRIKVSDNLFQKLPKKQDDIQKVLRLGLKSLNTRRQEPARSIVDQTFSSVVKWRPEQSPPIYSCHASKPL